MKISIWSVIILVTSACSSPASIKDEPSSAQISRAAILQAEIDNIVADYKLPGMTAAFVTEQGARAEAAAGFADVEASVPMQQRPRMLAASIGKSFVGALVVSLAAEKKLDLDQPVSMWLGKHMWFTRLANHESMTIRHLLTHSAGLHDHVHMEEFQKAFVVDWKKPQNAFPPQRLVGFILDKPALFEAGRGWSYTDTGYILLGMVIEEVTGTSYYEELSKRFLAPLQLTQTSPSNQRQLANLATAYLSKDNPFGLPPKSVDENGLLYLHPGIEWTGGGLVTTSADLARWGAALFDGKLLQAQAQSDLLTGVSIDPKNPNLKYGAGVSMLEQSPLGPVFGHAGWIPGYISSLRYYPEKGVTIAFQINTDAGKMASDESAVASIEQRLLRVASRSADN